MSLHVPIALPSRSFTSLLNIPLSPINTEPTTATPEARNGRKRAEGLDIKPEGEGWEAKQIGKEKDRALDVGRQWRSFGISLPLPTAPRRVCVLFLWLEKLRCLCQRLHSHMQHMEASPSWLDLENPARQSAGRHFPVLCEQTVEPQQGKYPPVNKRQCQIQICG